MTRKCLEMYLINRMQLIYSHNGGSLVGKTYHFYDFHHGLNAKMIQECGQVLFHLDAVVVHLGYGEDAHLAFPPDLKGQQHGSRKSDKSVCVHAEKFTLKKIIKCITLYKLLRLLGLKS